MDQTSRDFHSQKWKHCRRKLVGWCFYVFSNEMLCIKSNILRNKKKVCKCVTSNKISNQICLKCILYKLADRYGRVNTVVSVTSADSLSIKISREFECKQKYPRIKVGRELTCTIYITLTGFPFLIRIITYQCLKTNLTCTCPFCVIWKLMPPWTSLTKNYIFK